MENELLPLRLAYDESVRALADQASALESLRSRAGTVFAATALVISFLGGQALVRSEESPFALSLSSAGGWATTLFIALALLTLAILWPYRIRFSVSAGAMLAILDERLQESPVSAEEALRELALRHEEMYDYNAVRIRRLFWCFRLAIILLVGEVAAWIEVLRDVS